MAKSRIDETIRQLASETLKKKSGSSSAAESPVQTLGDPDCPHCHGIGYLRKDVPVGHPDFGEVFVCVCRRRRVANVVRDRLFALSHLDELRSLTFETFKPHGRPGIGERQANSIQMAYNQARHHAENLNGWLFLQGGPGCGKTHLAAAAANYAVDLGVPTLFLTVPDLLDTLRAAYDSEDTTFERRFEEVRSAQLLVLDDFGTQNASGWAQEKLFQIMNYRYINKLPTIVTSNLLLDEMDERVRSRLADPELVTQVRISAPDFRRPMEDSGHPELSSLELHSSHTFESFSMRKEEGLDASATRSLKEALSAAQDYAGDPRGWLVFSGDYATGKTHLAAAIANQRAQLGEPPLFVMVPDLLDHLRATFSPSSNATFDRRFEEIRTSRLLILDDLGTQSMTPWVREKLYQLFSYRTNAELPTIITIAADSLETLDPRLASRLRDERLCRIVFVSAPPFRGKPSANRHRPGKGKRP
ncbi:MAG TPA: ATP-binding protein [Anaerolineales bacterium]